MRKLRWVNSSVVAGAAREWPTPVWSPELPDSKSWPLLTVLSPDPVLSALLSLSSEALGFVQVPGQCFTEIQVLLCTWVFVLSSILLSSSSHESVDSCWGFCENTLVKLFGSESLPSKDKSKGPLSQVQKMEWLSPGLLHIFSYLSSFLIHDT